MLTLNRRTYVISSALLILLGMVGGVIFAITTHFAGASENVETIDLSTVKEDAIKELYDSEGRQKNPHRVMQDVVKDVDGGFGGYYFDPANPTTAYVYMKDTTKTTEAANIFRNLFPDNSKYTTIEVVRGAYTVDELTDWFYQAFAAVEAANVTVLSASMNIMENEFQLTVGNTSALATAWDVIDDLDIPRGAVSLSVGQTSRLADGDNVQAKWRPTVGGIKIEGPVECTLGFVALKDGVEGVVVASHCTNISERVGGNDHQPPTVSR